MYKYKWYTKITIDKEEQMNTSEIKVNEYKYAHVT